MTRTATGEGSRRGRTVLQLLFVSVLLLGAAVGPVAAQTDTPSQDELESDLEDQFQSIADLLVLLIGLVAVPNGAFGLLQWMTAGANEEKMQKGKTRIRNTFIALAGAAVIQVAVQLVDTML